MSQNTKLYSCMLDIGEAMLVCGADVHTVESVLGRLGHAYGALQMNVLVITSEIIATVMLPDEDELTLTRRITSIGDTNFDRLESLTDLCDSCCAKPLPLNELRSRFEAIQEKPFPSIALYLGGMFAAGGFAIFFGGSLIDGLVSALFALIVCFSLRHFRCYVPTAMAFNFLISLGMGLLICLGEMVIPGINIDMVIIGVIMLLIPGVAMTNATRDMLSGDTISGVMRFVESLLWASALAFGFMTALWLAGMLGIR